MLAPELNSGEASHGKEPVPGVEPYQDQSESNIEDDNETHNSVVLFIDVVVPDTHNRHQVIYYAH